MYSIYDMVVLCFYVVMGCEWCLQYVVFRGVSVQKLYISKYSLVMQGNALIVITTLREFPL